MKLGVIIAILVVAISIAATCFFSYIMLALVETFNKEYEAISNRDAAELENDEYNYGHDVEHKAYRE